MAHFQIFTGSYPTIYWIPADDKENVNMVIHGGQFDNPTWIWEHLAKEIEWIADLKDEIPELKDEL